ncbi:MAG: hypothetical protein KDI13_10490 [Alphaproteobacteria bacterium]|nr:hypothetical protein [Alphaproteobacteria bacterium]
MGDLIYHWIDILWLPIGYFGVHKRHRWWSVGFIAGCMLMMRLQAELLIYGGFTNGIMGLLHSSVYSRGLVTYGIFYALFFIIAHYSPRTEGVIFMAACLSIFFMAFFTTAIVMIL